MNDNRYYGKFKAIVTSTGDASRSGRLNVRVPLGGRDMVETVAEACVPYAGDRNGMFAIPPAGSGVWVEFQDGDPEKGLAVWSGCWWSDGGQLPEAFGPGPGLASLPVVLQSTGRHRLILSGGGGDAVVIETGRGESGPRIVMSDSSLKLSCGPTMSVEITESEVKINGDALVVR